MTTIIALIALIEINSPENIRICESIAFAESCGNYKAIGDGGRAHGAYQMHQVAWDDANAFRKKHKLATFAWSNRKYKGAQDIMCMSFVELIKVRYKADHDNRSPSPREIYMAYTMGYEGAKAIGFRILDAPEVKQRAVIRFMEKHRIGR